MSGLRDPAGPQLRLGTRFLPLLPRRYPPPQESSQVEAEDTLQAPRAIPVQLCVFTIPPTPHPAPTQLVCPNPDSLRYGLFIQNVHVL